MRCRRVTLTATALTVSLTMLVSAAAATEITPGEDRYEGTASEAIADFAREIAGTDTADDLRFRAGVGNDDGESCWHIEVDRAATEAALEGSFDEPNTTWIDTNDGIEVLTDGLAERMNGIFETIENLFGITLPTLPTERCPGSDPEDLVRVIWHSAVCPPPPPSPVSLAPQEQPLAGLESFLEIGSEQVVEIPCLGETVVAEARYVVHWGDGQTTETTSRGGGWPDGDVTHVYTHAEPHEIVVQAYWHGTWNGIDLGELEIPTQESLDIGVREVQAVRTG